MQPMALRCPFFLLPSSSCLCFGYTCFPFYLRICVFMCKPICIDYNDNHKYCNVMMMVFLLCTCHQKKKRKKRKYCSTTTRCERAKNKQTPFWIVRSSCYSKE